MAGAELGFRQAVTPTGRTPREQSPHDLRISLRIHPHGCNPTAGVTRHLPGWYNPRRHKSHA